MTLRETCVTSSIPAGSPSNLETTHSTKAPGNFLFLAEPCAGCGEEIGEGRARVRIDDHAYFCLACGLADADPENPWEDAVFNELKEADSYFLAYSYDPELDTEAI